MATLSKLELPDDLYHSMERRAGGEGISVAELVIRELSAMETARSLDEKKLLEDIRKERHDLAAKGVLITNEMVNEAKRWGRE
jgi:hypothetical protein